MPSIRTTAFSLATACLFLGSAASAAWDLNGEGSSFYYITSKAGAITEMNSFSGLSGQITDNGGASLVIDLSTVDTAIDIRNERMREMLFEVGEFPEARVRLDVNTAALDAMRAGATMQSSYDARLTIKDMEESVDAQVAVTKLSDGGLLVHSVQPVIVSAQTFGLGEGVEALREVAGLPNINNNVVVSFTLRYNPAD